MYSVLNTLLEYTYFYISKNITSYTFLRVYKFVENLQCVLKDKRAVLGRSQFFFKVSVLKIFLKLTRKHLCWSLYNIIRFLLNNYNFFKNGVQRSFLWNTSGVCLCIL